MAAGRRIGGLGGARRRRLTVALVALALAALVLGACQPERPSAGRGTPVRKVLIVGDSITWGLFGTTPRLHERLGPMMAARGVSTRVVGFAGSNIIDPWGDQPRWVDEVLHQVRVWDPDMIIVQSILFPGGQDPARQQVYQRSVRDLMNVARSRGAHTYIVAHPDPAHPAQRTEKNIAQYLQAYVAGPDVSRIPLDWWMARCPGWQSYDGWHLSGKGQDCHALAIVAAVDQLRARNG